jgi:Glycosyl transferases group 1
MRWTRAVEGAGSIARVWRAEGFAAVRDRVWDRVREASIRARCARGTQDGRVPWPSASILNVIGVPMTTAFGGVPLQLRARLRHESMVRPVALLLREPGDGPGQAGAWRLESWSGGRPRLAMTFPGGDGGGPASNGGGLAGDRGGRAGDRDGHPVRDDPFRDDDPFRNNPLRGDAPHGDPLRDDQAWRDAVRTCARLVNARAIHVENAAGLSLVSLSAIMGIDASADGPGLPVVLSVHDLSLFSRHPHGVSTHTTGPHADAASVPVAERGAAAHEAAVADRQRFEHAFHHALGTAIVRAAAFTIYPSQFMRHRIEALPHLPAHVVAPGIEPSATRSRSQRRPDQIAILGGGQEHKGGARLARIAGALAARGLHVTSYGGYGHEHLLRMRGINGVRVRGYYRAGSLPELLARQGASVALILSAVPESFSLVLSEAWAAGVPVVAPASGAFVERLGAPGATARASSTRSATSATSAASAAAPAEQPSRKGVLQAGGLLISSDASDEEILAAVDRARSTAWDALPSPPTAAQAAERHLALYRDAGFITATSS